MVKIEKILIVPDAHVPYEDKPSVSLMIRTAAKIKFDRIVTLGDQADFFQVSFHERKMERRMGFAREVRAVNKYLDQLDQLKIPRKNWLDGNHENRFNRYLSEKAPELIDLPGLTIPELFRLKQRGWAYTKYMDDIKIGKVYFTHDEGTAGPLAAMKARDTYGGNAVIGHCHSMTVGFKGNARGETHVGASFGWLGNKNRVDYMHRVKASRWTTGFGVGIHELSSGTIYLQPVPIVRGKCCVFGQIYS